MAHAVLSTPSFLGPLQALRHSLSQFASRWGARPSAASGGARRPRPQQNPDPVPVRPAPPLRALRVVRVVDTTQGGAGRMVISGRMAEVCAELERLAEHERQAERAARTQA